MGTLLGKWDVLCDVRSLTEILCSQLFLEQIEVGFLDKGYFLGTLLDRCGVSSVPGRKIKVSFEDEVHFLGTLLDVIFDIPGPPNKTPQYCREH